MVDAGAGGKAWGMGVTVGMGGLVGKTGVGGRMVAGGLGEREGEREGVFGQVNPGGNLREPHWGSQK